MTPVTLRELLRGISGGALALTLVLASPGVSPAAFPACDRDCLKGFADKVIASIVAHDPMALPLAPIYGATENSAPSAPNMMVVWRTASGAKNRYDVIDPTTGQVFLMATLSEGPHDTLLYGRIKVQDSKISELELYTTRSRGQGGFQFGSEGAANFPPAWTSTVPPGRRASRAELLQAGRSIFDTRIKAPEVAPGCVIMEDGKVVAENPDVAKSVGPANQANKPPAMTNSDGTVPIPCGNPPGRPTDPQARANIVDEEQGVVVSLAMVEGMTEPYLVTVPTESAFVPNAMLQPYADMLAKQQASGKFTAPALRPMRATQVVAELHRIYDGKLQGLMMLHSTGAPGASSPWVDQPSLTPSSVLAPGSKWVVAETQVLKGLNIPEGATLAAREGHSLTMTVNGTDTAIAAGSYQGQVVLTPTDEIMVKSASVAPHAFRTALYVDDGKVVPAKSVSAALVGGDVSDTKADHVSITSREENFNGIIVTGDSHYVINGPRIDLTGNGGDDTDGFGAGILSSGHADVTVNDAKITTRGAIRTALFIAGESTMRVNNSSIEVFSGALPPNYQFNIGDGKVMMEVPWMLGLRGTVRATNATDHGTVYYNHSRIMAHGWGALSTDGVRVVRMYVTDSSIETEGSGYGAYALEDAVDTFSHCTFKVNDYGLIIGGKGTGLFTDGTQVRSNKFGVMMHQGGGGGVTIEKGSAFHTRSTLIEVKGRGASIVIDNAKLQADNGILLQTMDNDDPFMKAIMARGAMAPGAGMSPGSAKAPGSDVTVRFNHVRLAGDLVHAMTDLGDLTVTLQSDASLEGAITTATAAPSTGKEPTRETYYLIGEVKNTFGPTSGAHGLICVLESGSKWTVTKTSYLNALKLADGAGITATKGSKVTLMVDGVVMPLKAGTYTGKITLQVART